MHWTRRMPVLSEVSALTLLRVHNAGATVNAKEGVVAGDEIPFAEVVLFVELHAGHGIDGHQDFLGHHERVEDGRGLVGGHGGIAPATVDDGGHALGYVGLVGGVHVSRDADIGDGAAGVGVSGYHASRGVH